LKFRRGKNCWEEKFEGMDFVGDFDFSLKFDFFFGDELVDLLSVFEEI
jgi:hypothetical protein